MIKLFLNDKILTVLAAAVLFAAGCGIKGPPLPSEKKTPAPPYKLGYHLADDQLSLSWSYPDGTNLVIVKGFQIFSAARDLSAGPCPGCPVEFVQVAAVGPDALIWNQKIEKGFRYYYRVRAFTETGVQSSYSNTVQFEYNP